MKSLETVMNLDTIIATLVQVPSAAANRNRRIDSFSLALDEKSKEFATHGAKVYV